MKANGRDKYRWSKHKKNWEKNLLRASRLTQITSTNVWMLQIVAIQWITRATDRSLERKKEERNIKKKETAIKPLTVYRARSIEIGNAENKSKRCIVLCRTWARLWASKRIASIEQENFSQNSLRHRKIATQTNNDCFWKLRFFA